MECRKFAYLYKLVVRTVRPLHNQIELKPNIKFYHLLISILKFSIKTNNKQNFLWHEIIEEPPEEPPEEPK